MEAVAHNPKFAKKAGIPQNVGRDFADADKASGKFMNKKRAMGGVNNDDTSGENKIADALYGNK